MQEGEARKEERAQGKQGGNAHQAVLQLIQLRRAAFREAAEPLLGERQRAGGVAPCHLRACHGRAAAHSHHSA